MQIILSGLAVLSDEAISFVIRVYKALLKPSNQLLRHNKSLELALHVVKEVLDILLNLLLQLLQGLGVLVHLLAGLLAKLLAELDWGRHSVATLLDDGGVVGLTATVPCEQVLGVARDVGESALGGNRDEVGLELLRGDVGDGVSRVLGWLERKQVGEESSNVRRGHRGTGDGVDGVLASNPGGLNVKAWGKDVIALAVVGEVGTLVGESASTDSDSVLSSGRRVVAGVGVVVASSHGEVDASLNSGVDGLVEDGRLATTQAHVGSRALEALSLALLGDGDLLRVSLGSVLDTLDDVGHGSGTVRAQDLDGLDVSLLRNTVLLAGNSARAVSSVSVSILISIAGWDSLAPRRTTLEVDVLSVCSGVDNVDINALTTVGGVEVLVEAAKGEAITVGDTGETPRRVLFELGLLRLESVNLLVLLNQLNLLFQRR